MRDPGLTLVEHARLAGGHEGGAAAHRRVRHDPHPVVRGPRGRPRDVPHRALDRDDTAQTPHEFYSFELTAGHLVACQAFLRADGLDAYVTFGLGDADLLLQHFCQPIDLCYLDAGESPVANLSQYRRAATWLRPPGMIVIDDVFDPRNADRGIVPCRTRASKAGRSRASMAGSR